MTAAGVGSGLQQLVPLLRYVLIGICPTPVHRLLLLSVVCDVVLAVAIAQPDDDDEEDEQDAPDAGRNADEDLCGEKLAG